MPAECGWFFLYFFVFLCSIILILNSLLWLFVRLPRSVQLNLLVKAFEYMGIYIFIFLLFHSHISRSSVRIGEYDTSSDPDCSSSGFCAPTVINHVISHVVIHPDYVNGQYHHDIALIVLKTPLNYTGEECHLWLIVRMGNAILNWF